VLAEQPDPFVSAGADRRDEASTFDELVEKRWRDRSAAALSTIASYGACAGRPSPPSPTSTLALPTPARMRFSTAAAARSGHHSMLQTWRETSEQRGLIAVAGTDLQDGLGAGEFERVDHHRDQ
jgi:hypothetical protein